MRRKVFQTVAFLLWVLEPEPKSQRRLYLIAPMKRILSSHQSALQTSHRVGSHEMTAEVERPRAELRAARLEVERRNEELASLKSAQLLLRENEQKATHRAFHDDVTGLPNRSYFQDRLDFALRLPGDLAVFYVDLDAFKSMNDEHGHHVGDDILRVVGQRMTGALRTSDLVCRFGGDEFACLLLGVPTFDHLAQMARKLLKTTSAPVDLDTGQFSVRISIGIARVPADGRNADALLQSADKAMYQAKRQRTGYAFHNTSSQGCAG